MMCGVLVQSWSTRTMTNRPHQPSRTKGSRRRELLIGQERSEGPSQRPLCSTAAACERQASSLELELGSAAPSKVL